MDPISLWIIEVNNNNNSTKNPTTKQLTKSLNTERCQSRNNIERSHFRNIFLNLLNTAKIKS